MIGSTSYLPYVHPERSEGSKDSSHAPQNYTEEMIRAKQSDVPLAAGSMLLRFM
jgi:hypothetical protein